MDQLSNLHWLAEFCITQNHSRKFMVQAIPKLKAQIKAICIILSNKLFCSISAWISTFEHHLYFQRSLCISPQLYSRNITAPFGKMPIYVITARQLSGTLGNSSLSIIQFIQQQLYHVIENPFSVILPRDRCVLLPYAVQPCVQIYTAHHYTKDFSGCVIHRGYRP